MKFVTVLWIAVAISLGAASGAAAFDEDFVVGTADTGVDVLDCCTVVLDAHSGPAGENPTGEASAFERAFFLGGPVTCLAVRGNRAVIGGAFGIAGYLFAVEDNAASGAPDIFSFATGPIAQPPTVCPTELPGSVPRPVTSGDLVVHDALGTPVSKTQCKNGGWRQFGFKNQGACVSFVATGGEKPPPGQSVGSATR